MIIIRCLIEPQKNEKLRAHSGKPEKSDGPTTALSRFVGAPFEILMEVAPPLPNFATVSPIGHILPWQNFG